MFILDIYHTIGITGAEAEEALDKINITVNKNQIWKDELPPMKSSGIRLGTAAMTTKGWKEEDFIELATCISRYLDDLKHNNKDNETIEYYKEFVEDLINKER